MFVTVPTMIARQIKPPEAHAIAQEFRQVAQRARSLSAHIKEESHPLQVGWQGNSKELFFEKFNKEPGKLLTLADWFDDRANFIESITVTIYVPGTERIWINA